MYRHILSDMYKSHRDVIIIVCNPAILAWDLSFMNNQSNDNKKYKEIEYFK